MSERIEERRPTDEIARVLCAFIEDELLRSQRGSVDPTRPLHQHGLGSMALFQVAVFIGRRFAVRLPIPQLLSRTTSVDSIAKIIAETDA
jgi:hypothetical protein